jgi:hypothetical protein
MDDLENKFPWLLFYCSRGLHPYSVNENYEEKVMHDAKLNGTKNCGYRRNRAGLLMGQRLL